MNSKILTIPFLFSTFLCSAQDTLNEHLVIAPIANNILYIGIENPISIAISNVSSKDLIVKTDNGILKGENGIYQIKPGKGSELSVSVYALRGKDTVYVGHSDFRLKNIPAPTIYIGNKTGTSEIPYRPTTTARVV